jgi:hypothetical protein
VAVAPHVIRAFDRRTGLRGWSEVELFSDGNPRRRIGVAIAEMFQAT